MKLVECVPNFSEGRNWQIIHAICDCIESVQDVHILHSDMNAGANRTVITFAGGPDAVCDAAVRVAGKALELIDMSKHTGAHPCTGALDVLPFVPLRGCSLAECEQLVKETVRQIGAKYDLPVIQYTHASNADHGRPLAEIRRGGFTGLKQRFMSGDIQADFGPDRPHPTGGITAAAARKILIAFNIGLNTQDVSVAQKIAGQIRTSSRVESEYRLAACQAMGWYISEYDCVQVSMNLLDYRSTSPARAYTAVQALADELDLAIIGSELVGMAPVAAFSDGAGKPGIQQVADELQLSAFKPFSAAEQIIEYRLTELGMLAPGADGIHILD